MIILNNISLQIKMKLLFKDVNLRILPEKRIGIVGINGSGKSSLFAMLLKELEPESGELIFRPDIKIGHLAQEMPSSDLSALEYTMSGNPETSILFEQLKKAEQAKDYLLVGEMHAKLSELNAYAIKSQAIKILIGLGFDETVHDKKVNEFSGGWRMRLNLAKVLMYSSDVLLLDEPTNHLDLEAIVWLENWLKNLKTTIVLISHDREFLDKIVQQIWHIDQQKITSYTGNFTSFEKQQAERLAQQQGAQKKQQAEIAHISKFIDRFRATASKSKQVQSRIKALEKLEEVAEIYVHHTISFEFPECGKLSPPLIDLNNVSFSYSEDNILLKNVSFAIAPGDRIGLLGKNGIGKSTLVKIIANNLQIKSGTITRNPNLKIGYFAQHQMEQLIPDNTPLQHLMDFGTNLNEKVLRQFLGGFGFTKDTVTQPVKNFSGGEKARLILAMLVFQKPNLLVLDEPTNHLDLDMREELSLALQTFSGAVLIVSHDRHLLQTVVDELWLIQDKKVKRFDGDLNDYTKLLANDGDTVNRAKAKQTSASPAKQTKQNSDLKKIEKSLNTHYERKKEIEAELSKINMQDNPTRFAELIAEFTAEDDKIKKLESDWIKLCEIAQ
jgi:ATP-binding cassette subfamily F protein 3